MSEPLPTGGFQWVQGLEELGRTISDLPANSPEGYILEVDLEYLEELHGEAHCLPGGA